MGEKPLIALGVGSLKGQKLCACPLSVRSSCSERTSVVSFFFIPFASPQCKLSKFRFMWNYCQKALASF